MGTISSIGKNVPEFWQNVVNCKTGIAPIQSVNMDGFTFKNGGEVKNYNPSEYYSQKELYLLDKFSQFGLISAKEAIKDAKIEWTDDLRMNCCVIMGSSIGGQDSQQDAFFDLYREGKSRVNLFSIPRIMPNAVASHITMEYGITGFAYTISAACASSNYAIGNAFWAIRNGTCDMAITGGSETPISYGFLKAWEALKVVAPDTCRPFSKGRQGMILGEGSGILVLESLDSAIKRNAKIHAELVGFGMSSDASHITKPDQKGAIRAMQTALKDADITPETVDYINAHGSGTAVNDSMEVSAIKTLFGEHSKKLAVSSTKSLHGHVLGATGALEAITSVLALKDQIYPPTGNFVEKDLECDLNVVPNKSQSGKMEYVMSNSFAFGGLNAVLIFRKFNK
jgi:nodulation protein E